LRQQTKEEIRDILERYGEEERSRAIASELFALRHEGKKDVFVKDIVGAVSRAVPAFDRDRALARVFQAFRIAVNDELSSLSIALDAAEHVLGLGGRVVVVSFHSLEDRIVKDFFRRPAWELVTKKPIVASQEERTVNSRSRSAKLRAAIHK
jgi:16S rRNA (cytosine1402-N4)-methyltransferase